MPTAKGNPEFKWTGEAHEALALALARMHGTIQKDQQAAVVKDMIDGGFQTSWEGIRQHLQKLKKKDGNGSAPATPTKPGIRVVKKKTPANGKKRGRPARIDLDRNDFDEDEDEKMDLKKPKLEMEAPNFGQSFGDEPSHPEDGEV